MSAARGFVVPALVWTLVMAPAACALCRVPRRVFLRGACLVGAIIVTGCLAAAALDIGVSENLSTSLDGHVYVFRRDEPYGRGDLIAYLWRGGLGYPAGSVFIKRVVGMPGDLVQRQGRMFYVASRYVGTAKPASRTGMPLDAAQGGVVALGTCFVATPSPDSLDSRYAAVGNVRQQDIIGRAHEVF